MQIAVSDLITGALGEIRAARAGDVPSAENMALGLSLLNELFDQMTAADRAPFSVTYTTSTLTPSLNPHLIGPTGSSTFVVTERPTEIPALDIVLQTNVRLAVTPSDRMWWMGLTAPAVTASVPLNYYYEASWPNGQLFFWPVPSVAYAVYWQQSTSFSSAVTLASTFDMPQGYPRYVRLTLAMMLAPAFNQTPSPETVRGQIEAAAIVYGNNDRIPRLNTRDAGMPGGNRGIDYYGYLSGWVK